MRRGLLVIGFWLISVAILSPVHAQDPSSEGTATIDAGISRIADFGADLHVELALSRSVPWQAFTLDAPRRLVLDFAEVDFGRSDLAAILMSDCVADLRMGQIRPGWSRLVFTLSEPMEIETAGMSTKMPDAAAVLKLQLAPTDAQTFTELSGRTAHDIFAQPSRVPPGVPAGARDPRRPLRVVLDPGHGAMGPGASVAGLVEGRETLRFARDVASLLRGAGIEVSLTRRDETFVPQDVRMAEARSAGADLLMSFHADALGGGAAGGAISTFAGAAWDIPPADLAAHPDRSDLLAGAAVAERASVNLPGGAPEATVVRSERLADALARSLSRRTGQPARRPRRRGAFTFLAAPDIPSVMVELGSPADAADRTRLADGDWRRAAARGILDAITDWAADDAGAPDVARR